MRTFKRWFYRIFVPFLVVALVAVVLRWVMLSQFYESNVLPPEEGARSYRQGGQGVSAGAAGDDEMPFSEENRQHVVAALEMSKSQLDRSLEQSPAEPGEETESELRERAQELDESIQRLRTANQENWERLRDEAYERLDQYATAVGRVTKNARQSESEA